MSIVVEFENLDWKDYRPGMNLVSDEWYLLQFRHTAGFKAAYATRDENDQIQFKDYHNNLIERSNVKYYAGFKGVYDRGKRWKSK